MPARCPPDLCPISLRSRSDIVRSPRTWTAQALELVPSFVIGDMCTLLIEAAQHKPDALSLHDLRPLTLAIAALLRAGSSALNGGVRLVRSPVVLAQARVDPTRLAIDHPSISLVLPISPHLHLHLPLTSAPISAPISCARSCSRCATTSSCRTRAVESMPPAGAAAAAGAATWAAGSPKRSLARAACAPPSPSLSQRPTLRSMPSRCAHPHLPASPRRLPFPPLMIITEDH